MQLLKIYLTNSPPEEDVPPAAAATASTAAATFKQHSRQVGEEVSSKEAAKITAAQFKHQKELTCMVAMAVANSRRQLLRDMGVSVFQHLQTSVLTTQRSGTGSGCRRIVNW